MRDIRKELIEMLIAEVKPAVGCTEPVAVALACAKAKELLGEEIEENRILVSPSIYKNGMCVGIPGTDRLGLKIAVAMGFVGGHSENGLTVLETLSQDEVEESERYMDTQPINVVPAQTKDKVFIEVDLRGKNNIAKVVIKEKHDNFVYLQKNQEVLLDTGDYNNNEEIKVADENVVERKATFMDTTNVEEIIKNVENMNFEDIKFLLDGIEMNMDMAKYGLENNIGIGVGRGIKESIDEGLLGDGIMTKAMLLTAAASDARMGGAKLPVIAMMGGVIAGEVAGYQESSFIAPLMYFVGIVAVLVSAIILKKTKPFSGKPAPFVMELPQYHIPQVKTVLLHVWERLKGFIIKAGTILFLACVVMWFLGGFGFTDGGFGMVEDSADSLMAAIGGVIAPIFAPLGFGEWQPVAASISGFTAKEAIVSTMGVLANVAGDTEDAVNVAAGVASWFPTGIAAFSFLMFNLLDSPCLAAIATMAKEMNDRKWFWFAILFQNIFAYVVCLCFYQIGSFVTGGAFGFGTVVGFVVLIVMLFLLFRPDPYKDQKVYSKRSVQA